MRLRHQTYQARSELRFERRRQRRVLQRIVALMLLGAVSAGVWGVTLGSSRGAQHLAWQNDLGGAVVAAPFDYDGLLLVSCVNGNLYGLDVDTGKTLWKFSAVFPLRSAPVAANGIAVVGCDDHYVYAVATRTGKEIWRFETGGPVQAGPAIADNLVFIGGDDQIARALNLRTGERVWQFKTNGAIYAAPLVAGDKVFIASLDANLYALDARTGALRWKYKAGASIYSSPALSGSVVGFGCDDHGLYGVDAESGKERWRLMRPAVVRSPLTSLGSDRFVAGDNAAKLCAVDVTSARLAWEADARSVIRCGAVQVEATTLVGTDRGQLLGFDSHTGHAQFAMDLGSRISGGLLVSKGLVIVPTERGGVFAVRFDAAQERLSK